MSSQRLFRVIIFSSLGALLLAGLASFGVQGQELKTDPAGALLARDQEGQRWLAAKESFQAKSLSAREKLDVLVPWAERYRVTLSGPLDTIVRRPEARVEAKAADLALAELEEGIDEAVRRSVAAKAWEPMGELASWEDFLARQGFVFAEDRPSQYIIGVRHRLYRRPPRLPQAIHTCLLKTREDDPTGVFGVTLRYTYPSEVAQEIERLEQEEGDYERALALRVPAFRADRPFLEALGKQALGDDWPASGRKWKELIAYVSEPAHIASRAKVLKKKNPPTISEVRLLGELAAHLYEFGPSGRLEVLPKGNALDTRGNPLYGARRSAR